MTGGGAVTGIQVTPDDLDAVATQLQTGSDEVDKQLTTMKTSVENLANAGWQGQAGAAFQETYQKWQTSAGTLKDALDGIKGLISESAKAYRAMEEELASKMRG
jgi:WXG100 family type VII secretion target